MTILDKELQFSDGQVITTSAASENIVDLGPAGPNGWSIGGTGNEWYIHFNVPVSFTAAGAATLAIALQTDSDPAFGSPTTLFTLPALALANLEAGDNAAYPIAVPYRVERYLRLFYTVATGPMTGGAITATGGAPPGTNIGY